MIPEDQYKPDNNRTFLEVWKEFNRILKNNGGIVMSSNDQALIRNDMVRLTLDFMGEEFPDWKYGENYHLVTSLHELVQLVIYEDKSNINDEWLKKFEAFIGLPVYVIKNWQGQSAIEFRL